MNEIREIRDSADEAYEKYLRGEIFLEEALLAQDKAIIAFENRKMELLQKHWTEESEAIEFNG